MSDYKPPGKCETIEDIELCVKVRDSGSSCYEGMPPKTQWERRDSLLVVEVARLRAAVHDAWQEGWCAAVGDYISNGTPKAFPTDAEWQDSDAHTAQYNP